MSWGEFTKSVLDKVEFRTAYALVGVGLAFCIIGLLIPESAFEAISIGDHAHRYRPYVGLLFVGLLVVFVSLTALGAIRLYDRRVARSLESKRSDESQSRLERRLETLTEDEKMVLRYYYAMKTRSNVLPVDDRVAHGLVRAGILILPGQQSFDGGFVFELSENARKHLDVNPGLLSGETNYYRGNETAFSRDRLFGL